MDHCPVLLEMQPSSNGGKKRPFRFQMCWLLDPTFLDVVSQAWGGANNIIEAVDSFTRNVMAWNKNQFGTIFTRKKILLARINGIQRAIATKPSSFLLKLEDDLLRDLDLVINQEEELWALKSRVNWMVQGYRNIAFYHVSTLVRRKRNQIIAIKNPVGEWIHEESDIKEFIGSGFNGIYSTSHEIALTDDPIMLHCQIRLSDGDRESIGGEVTEEEIKAALWSLKPFKAPGLDRLHANFFQKFWLLIRDSLVEEVKQIFRSGKMPEHLNKTLIALIPKI